jgi:single-strand DNA-binding protein
MANLNKVMLIGRLTRDPQRIRSNSGVEQPGVKFGFAVTNRKLDPQTQRWVDDPVFLDVEIWNRGENKQADRALETLHGPSKDEQGNRIPGPKASQIFIEGHLKLDRWTDKATQQERTKLVVVVENFQYLEPRSDSPMGGEEGLARPAPRQPAQPAQPAQPRSGGGSGGGAARPAAPAAGSRLYEGEPDDPVEAPAEPGGDDEIPF